LNFFCHSRESGNPLNKPGSGFMQSFNERVLTFIKSVPKGRVVSYGQAAAAAGSPRAARQVGGILRNLDITGSWGPQILAPGLTKRNLGKGTMFRRPKRAKRFLYAEAGGTIVPWWRVVNNRGEISIKGHWTASKEIQKQLLEKEAVAVDGNFKLDMGKYRWPGR